MARPLRKARRCTRPARISHRNVRRQRTVLQREHAAASPILRELLNLAPALLRATHEAWGYSRPYCLLEQLWLESYAGLVSASLHTADAAARAEGAAMALQVSAMCRGGNRH